MFGAWERQNNNRNLIGLLLLNSRKALLGIVLSGEPTRALPIRLLWARSSSDTVPLLQNLP